MLDRSRHSTYNSLHKNKEHPNANTDSSSTLCKHDLLQKQSSRVSSDHNNRGVYREYLQSKPCTSIMKRLNHIFENFSTSRREKRWIQKHEEYQLYFLLEKSHNGMHLYKGRVPPDRLLKKRFQNLLVHEICHNESNHPPEIVLQDLKKAINRTSSSGEQQDIFGMTPLHIYTLSSSQDLGIYELLLDSYPESVVTKDMYGKIPLFYALWGNKPSDVVNLLIKKQKTLFPHFSIHWARMIETMVGRK